MKKLGAKKTLKSSHANRKNNYHKIKKILKVKILKMLKTKNKWKFNMSKNSSYQKNTQISRKEAQKINTKGNIYKFYNKNL